jgi:hypothetical protein
VVKRKAGKVRFNIFLFDMPEQDGNLIERCGWGMTTEKDFETMIRRLGMEDTSTNIEQYDLHLER